MTDQAFATKARKRLTEKGATNIEIVTTAQQVGAKCRYKGKDYEITFSRTPNTDHIAKGMALTACDGLKART